jgi:multicomponent Na+:H+ antiporter subunit D
MDTLSLTGLVLPAAIPCLTALLVLALHRRPGVRDWAPVAGAALTLAAVLRLAPSVTAAAQPPLVLFTLYPGIAVSLGLDFLGLLFAATASLLWLAAAVYCIGYMRTLGEHAQTRFYVCYAVAVGGAMGVACSANLFTLYLFYELVTIFTYPLVMHHQDRDGYAGSRKYLVYLMFASKAFLLPAMAVLYVQCGTLDFALQGIRQGTLPAGAQPWLVRTIYVLFLLGFAKAALIPLHGWLPAAMVAPTPVSALLHAVVVVKVGVFSICRVMLSVFGIDLLQHLGLGMLTAYAASCTIIAASLVAMTKTDLKARLAYSTVSQLSYIILGVAMLTPYGMQGGLLHIPAHAFAKISLFFCAGAILAATGLKDIREMGGLGYRMPVTMGAFAVAALSMIGVPPVGGFVSKWFLSLGALAVPDMLLLGVILLSSLLNGYYFVEVVVRAFYGAPAPAAPAAGGACETAGLMPLMVVPLALTAALSVALGLYPELCLRIINRGVMP